MAVKSDRSQDNYKFKHPGTFTIRSEHLLCLVNGCTKVYQSSARQFVDSRLLSFGISLLLVF